MAHVSFKVEDMIAHEKQMLPLRRLRVSMTGCYVRFRYLHKFPSSRPNKGEAFREND